MQIAIDIGGTFTDVVAWNADGIAAVKVPSSRADPVSAGGGRLRDRRLLPLRAALHVALGPVRRPRRTWETWVDRADGSSDSIPSKGRFTLAEGDVLQVVSGGGYGNPLERAPDAVLEDVLDGKVSAAAAERQYGVVIVAGEVNRGATDRLRRDRARAGPANAMYDRGEPVE